jgi:hypothetical protein
MAWCSAKKKSTGTTLPFTFLSYFPHWFFLISFLLSCHSFPPPPNPEYFFLVLILSFVVFISPFFAFFPYSSCLGMLNNESEVGETGAKRFIEQKL